MKTEKQYKQEALDILLKGWVFICLSPLLILKLAWEWALLQVLLSDNKKNKFKLNLANLEGISIEDDFENEIPQNSLKRISYWKIEAVAATTFFMKPQMLYLEGPDGYRNITIQIPLIPFCNFKSSVSTIRLIRKYLIEIPKNTNKGL